MDPRGANDETAWRIFRGILMTAPLPFVALSALYGDWLQFGMILAVVALFAMALWKVANRSWALHIVLGGLIGNQVILLYLKSGEPNIGVVWFLVVPALAGTLGRRSHIVGWTPATLAAIVLCSNLPAQSPWSSHFLSLPNLIGAALVISAAAYGVVAEREARIDALEAALKLAEQAAKDETDAAARAQEAEQRVSRFLATMSHELRTPLTSIILSTELLSDRLVETELSRAARDAKVAADGLVLLLGDVLDLSKIRAGQFEVVRQRFTLSALLERVHALLSPLADASNVPLVVGAPPATHEHWLGDENRLRQVLINLGSNAIRHANRREVIVVGREQNGRLEFTVRDHGTGIPKEQLDAIFDPYVQVSNQRLSSGTGLGLSISRELVAAMGGRLVVESAVEVGSSFSFACGEPDGDMRLADSVAGSAESLGDSELMLVTSWLSPRASSPAAAPRAPREGARIALCVSRVATRVTLERTLHDAGFEVVAFRQSAVLTRALATDGFDAVVLDAELSQPSGIDVLRQWRSSDGRTSSVPVCMVSENLTHKESAMTSGANVYLLLPVRAAEFSLALSSLVVIGREATRPAEV